MMRYRLLLSLMIAATACGSNETVRDGAPGDEAADTSADARARAAERRRDRTCITEALSGRGVGELKLGLPVESIPVLCDVVSDSMVAADEGTMARKIMVAEDGDTAIAEIDSGRIWRIEVADAGIRTVDSLGVGTAADTLRRLAAAREITGEGRIYVVSPQHCGLSFQIVNAAVVRVLAIGCDEEQPRAPAPPPSP